MILAFQAVFKLACIGVSGLCVSFLKRTKQKRKVRSNMRFVGNLLWFVVFGGWAGGLVLVLLGCVCMITIVGIPFGIACFRISRFAFFPFGKALVSVEEVGGERLGGTWLMNFLWCVFCGFWLSCSAAIAGLACCFTIIGIPFGIAWFNISKAAFAPLGKKVVRKEIADAVERRKLDAELEAALSKGKRE